MDLSTRLFWGVVVALLGASAFFGVNAERSRRETHEAVATLETGDLVSLVSVTDGDSLVVKNPNGDRVSVHIIGIRAVEAAPGKDPMATYSTQCASTMRRMLEEKPIRVMLGTPPKDKHGRALATLFVDDHDVGLELVNAGLALVYTANPFPAMQGYLDAQSHAKADRKGLWGDPAAAARAELLVATWRKEAR